MMPKNRQQQGRLADMSLPPEQRGRRGRGKRQRKRVGGTPPAQLDHACGPKARKKAREGEAAMRRGRDQVSLETTKARADAGLAMDRWHAHRQHCTPCIAAQRARRPDQMCADGGPLYRAHRDADAELDRQRELDRQPAEGQEALWP